MTDNISAKTVVEKALGSDISGANIESNRESLGEVNADVHVPEAELSTVKGSTLKLNSPDTSELKALRHDFQRLLEYLGQNDVTRSSDVATPAIKKELEKKPDLKQRLFNAFKAGGIEALKVVFEHPLVSVSTEAIKAFLENS